MIQRWVYNQRPSESGLICLLKLLEKVALPPDRWLCWEEKVNWKLLMALTAAMWSIICPQSAQNENIIEKKKARDGERQMPAIII